MDWADPGFAYDHLAVTKDFVGSPHADVNDASHQYAMALGDWPRPGGELVVESEDGATRWVVDTRGRLARFDGRYVHWVRGFENRRVIGGEHDHHRKMTSTCRYSVVFYVNKPQNGTRRGAQVDVAWTPAGRGAAGAAGAAAFGVSRGSGRGGGRPGGRFANATGTRRDDAREGVMRQSSRLFEGGIAGREV